MVGGAEGPDNIKKINKYLITSTYLIHQGETFISFSYLIMKN